MIPAQNYTVTPLNEPVQPTKRYLDDDDQEDNAQNDEEEEEKEETEEERVAREAKEAKMEEDKVRHEFENKFDHSENFDYYGMRNYHNYSDMTWAQVDEQFLLLQKNAPVSLTILA